MSDFQLLDKSSAACTFDAVVFKQYGGIPWRNVTDQPGCCTTQHIRDNTSGDVGIGQYAIGLDTSSCNVTLYSDKFYTLTFSKGVPSRIDLTEQDCGRLEINASYVPHSYDPSAFSFDFGSISQYLNFSCDDEAAAVGFLQALASRTMADDRHIVTDHFKIGLAPFFDLDDHGGNVGDSDSANPAIFLNKGCIYDNIYIVKCFDLRPAILSIQRLRATIRATVDIGSRVCVFLTARQLHRLQSLSPSIQVNGLIARICIGIEGFHVIDRAIAEVPRCW